MNNFFDELITTLKSNKEYLSDEGILLKNKVYELAMKMDDYLIKLLFNNNTIREVLFKNIDGKYIFDKTEFAWIISNKEFLPDSYTGFRNKIGLENKENRFDANDIVLTWPFKDCILNGGQNKEEQKRDEVFYNEILGYNEIDRLLDEKVFTNFKRYHTNSVQNVNSIEENDNLIIKGNNLLVISSLLRKYENKVKMIYIDPPYNTAGAADSFVYNNTFKHSTWLTFMKNRLEIAKKMLKEDGFIAVAIDHAELFYLGVILDEIFGRENRLGIISVLHNPEGRQNAVYFTATNEFMLVYRKSEAAKFNPVFLQENFKNSKELSQVYNYEDENGIYKQEDFIRLGGGNACLRINKPSGWYPLYVSKDLKEITLSKKEGYTEVFPITDSGQERTWKIISSSFEEKYNKGDIYALKTNDKIKIYEKYRIDKGSPITTCWINSKYNSKTNGTNLIEEMFDEKVFSYPKSIYTVIDSLKIMTNENDIVMDFFAGSGTTGHAVEELNKEDGGNRKYILIEQMDYVETVTLERMKKVIEENKVGSFVFMELKRINEVFIDLIKKAENDEQILKLFNELKQNAFINHRVDIELFNQNTEEFTKLSIIEKKKILFDIIDKNMLYLNYSDIDDIDYEVSENDKLLNHKFYKGDF